MISLAVLLLLFCLLICPVTFRISYRDTLSVSVKYLFFQVQLAPVPEKPEKPKRKKKEKEPYNAGVSEKIKALYRQEGLGGFLKIFGKAAKIGGGAAKSILTHLAFSWFDLSISVGGEDAAQTALNYGRTCGAVSSAAGIFLGKAKCRKSCITIFPDFGSSDSQVNFSTKVSVKAFFLLSAALRALFRLIKLIRPLKTATVAAR